MPQPSKETIEVIEDPYGSAIKVSKSHDPEGRPEIWVETSDLGARRQWTGSAIKLVDIGEIEQVARSIAEASETLFRTANEVNAGGNIAKRNFWHNMNTDHDLHPTVFVGDSERRPNAGMFMYYDRRVGGDMMELDLAVCLNNATFIDRRTFDQLSEVLLGTRVLLQPVAV